MSAETSKPRTEWVSAVVGNIAMSAIKEMAMRSACVEGAVSLAWGLPSFRTPEYIRKRVEQELWDDPDIGKYALPDGLRALRRAVAVEHKAATGIEVDAERNILITAGNMQGLNTIFHVLIDPGDEIIVTDPGFASHFQQIHMCSGRAVHWRMDESDNWALDLGTLPSLITGRTKAIVLVTPSNPTGKIFTETELREVGRIAAANDIVVILDDPYCHFTYENHKRFFNLSSVKALSDRIVYLFTFSKTYAMSGWRVGYMIIPETLKDDVLKVHDSTLICAPRISQVAALAALTGDRSHLVEFESTLASRRQLICERLDAVPHIFDYVKPEGAYYVFPRITAKHLDSRQFSIDLLEKARVSVTPGSAFGAAGENHVRMAYCVEEDAINLAFDRIEEYFGH